MNDIQFAQVKILSNKIEKLEKLLEGSQPTKDILEPIEKPIRRILGKYGANDELITDTITRYEFKRLYSRYFVAKSKIRENFGNIGWENYGIPVPGLNEEKPTPQYHLDISLTENDNILEEIHQL